MIFLIVRGFIFMNTMPDPVDGTAIKKKLNAVFEVILGKTTYEFYTV